MPKGEFQNREKGPSSEPLVPSLHESAVDGGGRRVACVGGEIAIARYKIQTPDKSAVETKKKRKMGNKRRLESRESMAESLRA